MKQISSFIILSVVLLLMQTPCFADKPDYTLEIIKSYSLNGFPEPSGLSYSKERNTLFMVGDEGHIAEISLEGEILNIEYLGKRDLEGITVYSGSDELILLDESRNQLLLLNTDDLKITNIAELPDKAKGPYEGLSADKEGGLVLVNQVASKKASGYILRLFKNGDVEKYKTHIKDQSAVLFTNEGIYILSDQQDRMYFYNTGGELQWKCHLPGDNQEGLAIDSEGFFYIAQDSGGMLKMKLKGEFDE